jgi:hypothetical protein
MVNDKAASFKLQASKSLIKDKGIKATRHKANTEYSYTTPRQLVN